MYKAIIVDDEIIVRNAIKTMIPWDKCGVELVGTASNGIKALELVDQKNPDIIITDIKMPMMDGIEMIHQLKEQGFNGEILVLSNYDDLELVKKALKSGVYDYVLKLTVQSKDFERLFSDIIQKLYQKTNKENTISNHTISNFEQRREELISNLYVSPHHYGHLMEELNNLEVKENDRSFFSIIVSPVRLERNNNVQLKEILRSISNEIFLGSNWNVVVEPEPSTFLVTVSFNRLLHMDDPFNLSERISNLLYMYYDIRVIIVYSRVFTNLRILTQEVEKGKKKVGLAFYQFEESVCLSGNVKTVEKTKKINDLTESFFDGNWKEHFQRGENYLIQWLKRLIELAKEERLEPIHLKKIIIRIVWHVERKLHVVDWFDNQADEYKFLKEQEILDATNEHELINLLSEFSSKINGLAIERTDIDRKEVIQAMNYIKENLSTKLTISDIASYVNLSEAYVSKVFKAETGKSIIAYVNELRMQKAYHLLEQGEYLVKEVSWQVGIDDPFYFNRLFKKEFGISPNQVKKEKDKSTFN
ncbi:response regulator transcription factor [Gracilibacillus sp. D59]|uniref:response regulator transcription factor n=1 Tax=Gracilibacillus sp. D59 TaxID=3457434 RepID=UPI003FCD8FAA